MLIAHQRTKGSGYMCMNRVFIGRGRQSECSPDHVRMKKTGPRYACPAMSRATTQPAVASSDLALPSFLGRG